MVDQWFDLSIYRNLSLEEIIDNPCMFFINNYIITKCILQNVVAVEKGWDCFNDQNNSTFY